MLDLAAGILIPDQVAYEFQLVAQYFYYVNNIRSMKNIAIQYQRLIKGELKAAMAEELRKHLPVYVPTYEVKPKGSDKTASLTPSNNPVSQPCYRRQDYFGNTLH